MTLTVDPELAEALAPIVAMSAGLERPAVGDWRSRRQGSEALLPMLVQTLPSCAEVSRTAYEVGTKDGATIPLTWFAPPGPPRGSAGLYLHGGGMIFGSVALYDRIIARYVRDSGVPLLAVDYRLAPEHPYPTPVEDCYAALLWLVEHAGDLAFDAARVAVMGDSAGGNLAAAVALLAADRQGPALRQQILVYPMLDDRTVQADPEIAPMAMWSYEDNITAWDAILGSLARGAVPAYAAPARRTEVAGLPAAYIDVGQLDIFRDEATAYAAALSRAGVPVELHVHPGAVHAFEVFAPDSDVARRAVGDRVRRLRLL